MYEIYYKLLINTTIETLCTWNVKDVHVTNSILYIT